jgi:hypothetical protein
MTANFGHAGGIRRIKVGLEYSDRGEIVYMRGFRQVSRLCFGKPQCQSERGHLDDATNFCGQEKSILTQSLGLDESIITSDRKLRHAGGIRRIKVGLEYSDRGEIVYV